MRMKSAIFATSFTLLCAPALGASVADAPALDDLKALVEWILAAK